MSVVVDASVVVAVVVVADERQHAARAHLDGWLEAGEGLRAPAVLPYEVANFARLVFDGMLEVADVAETWHDLAALGLILHPFDLAHDGPEVVAVTARLRRRHATDSAHLCLAQRLGTAVWTLDGALARNADVGLPVELIS